MPCVSSDPWFVKKSIANVLLTMWTIIDMKITFNYNSYLISIKFVFILSFPFGKFKFWVS